MNHVVKRRADWSLIALLAPATLLMVLVFLVPFFLLLITSFWRFVPGSYIPVTIFTLENYAKVIQDPYYWSVYKETIYISFPATAIVAVLAYPLARLISQQKTGLRGLLLVLVTLPMIGGAMIQTLGLEILLMRYGVINDLLQSLGIIRHPITFLGNEAGITIGLVQAFLPLMVIPLTSSLSAIGKSMEDAAKSLGANPIRAFFEVIFPLSLPGAIAGAILVMMASLTSFVTPLMLGQGRIMVFGTQAYQLAIQVMNWPFASAFAIFFIFLAAVVAVLVYFVSRFFNKRRVY